MIKLVSSTYCIYYPSLHLFLWQIMPCAMTSPFYMLIVNSRHFYIQSNRKNKPKKGIKMDADSQFTVEMFGFGVIKFDGGCFVCAGRKGRADAWCSRWSSSLKFKHLSNMVVHKYFWSVSSECVTARMALKLLYKHTFLFLAFPHPYANIEEIPLRIPLFNLYTINLTRCLLRAVSHFSC